MNFIQRLLAPKEIRGVIGVLDELQCVFPPSLAFSMVRREVETLVLSHQTACVAMVRRGATIRAWVLVRVADTAGDHLETGEYHMCRGALDPMGPGEDLLRLYDLATDALVQMGFEKPEGAQSKKDGLRRNMQKVG